MKSIKYILLTLLTVFMASCNSEDNNYEIAYTKTWPLDGQYKVTVTDATGAVVKSGLFCYISNTVDDVNNKIWLRIGNYNQAAKDAFGINGKLDCDVAALTFSGQTQNLSGNVATSTETFSVTSGSIVLKGAKAPSGTVCDKISFTFTRTNFPGKTYKVEGYRYTGWPED